MIEPEHEYCENCTPRESLSAMENAQAAWYMAQADEVRQKERYLNAEAAVKELVLQKETKGMETFMYEQEKKYAGDEFHHVYRFIGNVTDESAKKCIDQLSIWSRTSKEGEPCSIEIIFNSGGGSVIAGMALFDFIQELRGKDHHITTVAMGMAASMAGILLQAGDERVMGKQAYVLIHEAQFGVGGSMGQVEDEVEFVKKIQKRIVKIFAERSKLTAAQINRKWKRKNWWLDSDECLKLGIVDEVR